MAKNVLVYGAGGDNIGRYILEALIADPTYNVTILSRRSSKSKYPAGAKVIRVSDDLPHAELIDTLKGQDIVISTVSSGPGALETQYGLIDAAVEAGVKRFIPSEYGLDNADPKAQWLSPGFKLKGDIADYLDAKAKANPDFSWTAVACGTWLDWCLDINFIGIDTAKHTVSYWDNGTHAISCTTLKHAAQGVLQCLKHSEKTKNQRVFSEPFAASQRDVVAELEKQQGVKYSEVDPVDSRVAIEDAHKRLASPGQVDLEAIYTTVKAEILLDGYGSDFVKSGKKPLLEDLTKMPKLTLQDAVRDFLASASKKV